MQQTGDHEIAVIYGRMEGAPAKRFYLKKGKPETQKIF